MKRLLLTICVFLLMSQLNCTGEWKLVWSDEFENDGLPNEAKWNYEEGFVRNQEMHYYTRARKENSRIENGMLVIEARKENYRNPAFEPDHPEKNWMRTRQNAEFTSASLTTRERASWRYGRIEVRAKLPTGRGMWPAIWMLGTNMNKVGWPTCGEIDIMENVGFNPDWIHANIHNKKYNHMIGTGKGSKIEISKPHESFHIYAIEWYKDRIDFFVDDQKYFTFSDEGTGNEAWPFDKEHYLILNIAVGGSWGGQKGIDPTIFPQRMVVDYVRVYQKNVD